MRLKWSKKATAPCGSFKLEVIHVPDLGIKSIRYKPGYYVRCQFRDYNFPVQLKGENVVKHKTELQAKAAAEKWVVSEVRKARKVLWH